MYPSPPPEPFPSSAEKQLYHLFDEQLSDEYIVMHGTPWMEANTERHHQEGEIDFLIIHPKIGLLVLEAKGGRIELRDGRWFSIDRHGVVHPLNHSPISQAQNGMRALRNRLANSPSTRPFAPRYRIQSGVVFPNIVKPKEGFGPDTPPQLIIDSSDLNSLEYAVREVAGIRQPKDHLSGDAIKSLVNLLRPTVRVEKLGYAARLHRTAAEIDRLTDQQYDILESLRHHNQLAIAGCAGSGKTMLAMKRARFLAQSGQRVLFTCFNRPLSDWLQETFAADQETPQENIRVENFDQLAHNLLKESGTHVPAQPRHSKQNNYYSDILPSALSAAIELGEVTDRFDAIIVDEGQDFSDVRWLCLQQLLRNPEDGIFYIFFDSEQGIYEQGSNLPVRISDTVLTRNCRNTDQIHQQLLDYYPGLDKPRSSEIGGFEPEKFPIERHETAKTLRQTFERLFNHEGLPTSDVVVLTFASQSRSVLEQDQRVGSYLLTWEKPEYDNHVQVSSVQRFKGLERPIVILIPEIEHIPRDAWDRLLYVGISRARQHLIVIGELPEPQQNPVPVEPVVKVQPPESEPTEESISAEQMPSADQPPQFDPVQVINESDSPRVKPVDHPREEVDVSGTDEQPSTLPPPPIPATSHSASAGGSVSTGKARDDDASRPSPQNRLAPRKPSPLANERPRVSTIDLTPQTDTERLLAAAGYLIWLLIPIYVLLTNKTSTFARRHAWQSILFSVGSGVYFFGFLIFWAIMFEISVALACIAGFGWFFPPAVACYYAYKVYTRSQSHFLVLTDLVRALFRGV
jgi:hypothetical protein